MPTKGDQDTLLTEFYTVSKTLYAGSLLGAFFAVVLYCAFAAHMVEGSLFPTMNTQAAQPRTMGDHKKFNQTQTPGPNDEAASSQTSS